MRSIDHGAKDLKLRENGKIGYKGGWTKLKR
jgi:hypothetical protein